MKGHLAAATAFVTGILLGGWLFHEWSRRTAAGIPAAADETAVRPLRIMVDRAAPAASVVQAEDPVAVFERLLEEPREFTQTAQLYALGVSVSKPDLLRLIDRAATVSPAGERFAATNILYTRLAELDPEFAVAHLVRRREPSTIQWLSSVFRTWARMDLEAAVAAVEKLDTQLREPAGLAILTGIETWTLTDRRQVAQTLGLEDRLDQIDMALLQRGLGTDPGADWRATAGIPDPEKRMQQRMVIAHSWARIDPEAVMIEIAALEEEQERLLMAQQILQIWGQAGGEEALAWVRENMAHETQERMLLAVLNGLARNDPETALREAALLSTESERVASMNIIRHWAARDLQAATQWVMAEPDATLRRDMIADLSSIRGGRDAAAALVWMKSLPHELGQAAAPTILRQLARTDPELAVREAMALIPAEAPNLVRRWAAGDAAAALRWARASLDAQVLKGLEPQLIGRLAGQDLSAALTAISGLADERARDQARVQVILRIAREDEAPALLARVYGSIDEVEMKQQAAQLLHTRLKARHPDLAEHYRREAGSLALERPP